MVKIIFSRVGRKKNPQYRIVAMDKQKDPWGRSLEILGNYNPQTKDLTLKEDRIKEWIGVGAQPSETVHNLLVQNGVIKDKKVRVSTISKKRAERLQEKNQAKAEADAAKQEKEDEKKAATEPKVKVKVKEEAPAEEKKEDEKK